MMPELIEYEEHIGNLSMRALQRGDVDLLDRVTTALGVATRHLERIRRGELTLSPAVAREIDASFDAAETLLQPKNATSLDLRRRARRR